MIKVTGQNSLRTPFEREDNRIIREFAPTLPLLREILERSRSSHTDPDQAYSRQFSEERRKYILRWHEANSETKAKMARAEEDGGRLVVRTTTYASSIGAFKEIANVLMQDALHFEPPVEIDEHAIEVMHYAGQSYKRTYGFEVSLPSNSGIVVPINYSRVIQTELTF